MRSDYTGHLLHLSYIVFHWAITLYKKIYLCIEYIHFGTFQVSIDLYLHIFTKCQGIKQRWDEIPHMTCFFLCNTDRVHSLNVGCDVYCNLFEEPNSDCNNKVLFCLPLSLFIPALWLSFPWTELQQTGGPRLFEALALFIPCINMWIIHATTRDPEPGSHCNQMSGRCKQCIQCVCIRLVLGRKVLRCIIFFLNS